MATQATGRTASRVTRTAWPAGVPVPVQNRNGDWWVPIWTPDRGWELSEFFGEKYEYLGKAPELTSRGARRAA